MSGTYEISLSSPKLGRASSFRRRSSLPKKSDLRKDAYEQEVLMRWVNHILERPIDSPDTLDFSDGVCLIKLVDKLAHTNKTIQTHSTPILQFQKHHNYQSMLNFLTAQQGVKLPSEINADGLLLSDAQMQYKLVWKLVQHYKLHTSELLLDWVNKLVAVRKVKNFEADWSDGVVLYTFVNTIVKGNTPDSCYANKLSPQNLINSAVTTANDILYIPPILIDFSSPNICPSSKSLLVYLSCFLRPYYSNIKRWLHSVLPGNKITDFQSCWSNGHLLALLLEKIHPGLCKDILKSYTCKRMSTDTQRSNVTELLRIIKKTLSISINLDANALVNRTAESLSIAMLLDDIRQYSLVKCPIRKHLALQTSDYETASLDSFSTNSVTRTFSEVSMTYADTVNNRYREKFRSKSFESLDKFHEPVARLDNCSSCSSIKQPNTSLPQNESAPFDRKDVERHSSASMKKMAYDIPTHLTYSLDYYLGSEKSNPSEVGAGIREVPMPLPVRKQIGVKLEGGDKKWRPNQCCAITSLILIISLLFLLMLGAGSAVVFCTVGHHCGRK